MKNAVHFVGFKDPRYSKDPRYERARRVFGVPDFIHTGWDNRAKVEVMEGDVVIFAKGTADQEPGKFSFDDSEMF